MYIDADTHVDECDETWAYIPKSYEDMVPRTIAFEDEQIPSWLSGGRSSGSGYYRCWLIDGQLYPRRVRDDERTRTTRETRELVDVSARLSDMDRLGVETQVIFPTLFLSEVTRRAELEVALYRSYNRWIAERCADGGGRLRWVAMIPFSSVPDALRELEFAKDHGACGLFKRGVEGGGRAAGDPYFDRVYAAASELDLAICIHQARAWTAAQGPYSQRPVGVVESFRVVAAFSSLLEDKVAERFPDLRFGFIESSAAWLSFVLGLAGWNVRRDQERSRSIGDINCYVTCEVYEDIPYLIDIAGGDDNFVVGSDYSHGDRASVIDAHRLIAERADVGDKSARKITSENARALYSL